MSFRNIPEHVDKQDVNVVIKIYKQLQCFSGDHEYFREQVKTIFELIKSKSIDELRNHLRDLLNLPDINDSDNKDIKLFAKAIHTLALILAKYFPRNSLNDEGMIECVNNNNVILPSSRLLLSSGYQMDSGFSADDKKEGQASNPYSYLYTNEAKREFKPHIDNNRTEIEYLEKRLVEIHTSSRKPEIPSLSEVKKTAYKLINKGPGNKLIFGSAFVGFILSLVLAYHFLKDNISFRKDSDYANTALSLFFMLFGGLFGGLSTSEIVKFIFNGINKFYACCPAIQEHYLSNLLDDKMNIFLPPSTHTIVNIQDASASSDNSDLAASLLRNRTVSDAERRDAQQQFFIFSPPRDSRTNNLTNEIEIGCAARAPQ